MNKIRRLGRARTFSLEASVALGLLIVTAAVANARPAPTANELLSRPAVKEALDDAWEDSRPTNAVDRHEEGGWIYVDTATGELRIYRAPAGTRSSIDLSGPPCMLGLFLIADFHTHPNPNVEGWENSPSPDDISSAWAAGVPDLVRSEDGAHACGPSSRAGGLAGSPGYPGKAQGAHSDEPAPKDVPNGGPSGGPLHASINLQPGASQSWDVAYDAVALGKPGSDTIQLGWSRTSCCLFVAVRAKAGDAIASVSDTGGALMLSWYGRSNQIYTITVKNLSTTDAVAADVDFK